MIRRGIVLVHGVGNQRRAEQLDWVVEDLVECLGRWLGRDRVHLAAWTSPDDRGVAHASIHLHTSGTAEPDEVWEVREAWWARSFRPSNSGTVLGWAVSAFITYARQVWYWVGERNLGRIVGRPPDRQGSGVWQVASAGTWLYALAELAVWAVYAVLFALLYAVSCILILPVYVFLALPALLIWPDAVGRIQRAVVNRLTGGIGDQQAMTNRHVAVAGASQVVCHALRPFLDPEVLARSGDVYDTVTIVAHSGGCVVSYVALASPVVAGWLEREPHGRRVSWVTAGSGLNLAWRMRAKRKDRDLAYWSGKIHDRVNWIDVYARYDPVPPGEAPADMVRQILGRAPGPYVSVRVANHDWPLTEHGGYWGNYAEVMSRIVHVIADSRLGRQALDPEHGEFLPGALGDQLRAAVEFADAHRRQVTNEVLLRLAVGGAVLAGLVLFRGPVERLGSASAEIVGRLTPLGWLGQQIAAWPALAAWLMPLAPLGMWAVGAALLGYVALAIVLLVGLFGELKNRNAVQHDENHAPERCPWQPPPQRAAEVQAQALHS